MTLLLRHRIFLGYIILIAVIGSMAAIMFHEQNRIKEIETDTVEIDNIRRNVTAAHCEITELATLVICKFSCAFF